MRLQETFASNLSCPAKDIQKIVPTNLGSSLNGYKKHILELNIEKCFDRINHDQLI